MQELANHQNKIHVFIFKHNKKPTTCDRPHTLCLWHCNVVCHVFCLYVEKDCQVLCEVVETIMAAVQVIQSNFLISVNPHELHG